MANYQDNLLQTSQLLSDFGLCLETKTLISSSGNPFLEQRNFPIVYFSDTPTLLHIVLASCALRKDQTQTDNFHNHLPFIVPEPVASTPFTGTALFNTMREKNRNTVVSASTA